jgi:arylsulfatase A-like enzyme
VVEKYQTKLDAIPEEQRENFNPVYAAMVEAVDTSVGRVVETVDKLGLADNTVIIFTSDNGGLPNVSQLAPLRSCKGSLFEGGIRVPLCVRWKGVTPPGSTCDVPISSVDMLPTFAALAGAELPTGQPIDGSDLSPLFRGGKIPERALFWHYPLYLEGPGHTIDLPNGKTYSWRGVPASAMRRGDFKLKEYFEDNSIALYNIRQDPGEQNNLAAAMPELAAKMRAELDAWQAETKAPIPTTPNPECILARKAENVEK